MKENIYIISLIQIKMKYFYYFSLSNVHTNAINFRCYFRYETPEGNSTVPLKVYHHPSEAFFYSNNRSKRLTMESIARILYTTESIISIYRCIDMDDASKDCRR